MNHLKIFSTALLILFSAGAHAETVLERSRGLSSEACRRVCEERGLCFAHGLRVALDGVCAIVPNPVFFMPAIGDLIWNRPWKEVTLHKRHAHRLSGVKDSLGRAVEFLLWVEIAYQKRFAITEDPNFPQYYEKKFPEEFRKNLESVRQPGESLMHLILRARDADKTGMNGLSERHDVDACDHFFDEVIERTKEHILSSEAEEVDVNGIEEGSFSGGGS